MELDYQLGHAMRRSPARKDRESKNGGKTGGNKVLSWSQEQVLSRTAILEDLPTYQEGLRHGNRRLAIHDLVRRKEELQQPILPPIFRDNDVRSCFDEAIALPHID